MRILEEEPRMSKKKTKLQIAQEKAEAAIRKTNKKITILGENTNDLHNALQEIQESFDKIRNVPSDKKLEYEELKAIRLNWKQQAEKIDKDYKDACLKNTGKGVAGISAGIAVAALGPTAAMGVATTFGVASTGTAISTLSGAAATNAALAWLGGGAIAAGGGGMVAGNALLALAGPIGWAIAGVALLSSGLLFWKAKCDQRRRENIFTLISERDVTYYNLAIVELNERITRIKEDVFNLKDAINDIATFGLDYDLMTERQQYALGSYFNYMSASTQLLVNPIMGLQPKYCEADLMTFISKTKARVKKSHKNIIIALANLLFKIEIDDKDKVVLFKSLKKNKAFLSSLEIKKTDFDIGILDTTIKALQYKYQA